MADAAQGAAKNGALSRALLMPRAVVIINPLSGRGRHDTEIGTDAALALDVLGRFNVKAQVRTTSGPGDAHRFAREAADEGVDLVVVWGGDGTINEAASGLVHRNIPLGIVPAGSGNGLASDLSVPFTPIEALTVAATGQNYAMDAGQVHDSLFFNIAGIGIDAIIAARFAERGLRNRGRLGYLKIGLGELMRRRTERYEICVDEGKVEYHALLVAIANGRQYGNQVCIAPGARLDDGLLELVIVEPQSTLKIAMRLPSLFSGRLRAGGGVTMRTIREMVVRADREIPFHVDGEPRVGPAELAVHVLPHALLVRTPH
jgi:YegS/Rv2252/BmrU family lipid kinase